MRSLAIQAYPDQYTGRFRLRNGIEATIRSIRPDDEPLIVAMHATLSDETIRMRYFSLVRRLSHERLTRLCDLDYACEMALVAEEQRADGPHLLGVSRYYNEPETGDAEFAVLVTDHYQGQGLGRHLMERLIAVARDRGIRRLVGLVLRENLPMLGLLRKLGFHIHPSEDPLAVGAVLEL